MNKKGKNLAKKCINILLNAVIALLGIVLLISIYTSFQIKILNKGYADFFGYSLFDVQTGSMSGTIEAGDWIIIELTKDVKINDIITYKKDEDYITHRIIESYKGTYTTKGDANNKKDEPIHHTQVLGKVVKILPRFGIVRKTIFNPAVLIAITITLMFFSLTFDKSPKLQKALKALKNKVPKKEEIKIVQIDLGENKKDKPVIVDLNLNKDTEDKKEISTEEEIEEKLSKTSMFRVLSVDNSDVKEKFDFEANELTEEEIEESLSKTSMFRVLSVDNSDVKEKFDFETNELTEEEKEEDLSKTTSFRFISVDTKDIYEKENKIQAQNMPVEEEEIKPSRQEMVKGEIEEKKRELPQSIKEKINSKKSKNLVEKFINIKKIELNEIIDILIKDEKAYIIKSNVRNLFMEHYINLKYYNDIRTISKIKSSIDAYTNYLLEKNVRDDREQNIIKTYSFVFILLACMEQGNKNDKQYYASVMKRLGKFEEEYIEYVVHSIIKIKKECETIFNNTAKQLETTMFDIKYNKLSSKKDFYVVELNHNISFSKVYSDYIVDKVYSEGMIAEDKIEVLITLLHNQIAKDMMNSEFNKKYIFFIPSNLYTKEKKLEGLLNDMNNEYVKNHVYIANNIEQVSNYKEIIQKLYKKGYKFVTNINKEDSIKKGDVKLLYLSDYLFTNNENINLPLELMNNVIKENIENKISDSRGN